MNTATTATQNVLMHHLTAFGENNLDEILLDYSEESLILTDQGKIQGLNNIRQLFEAMFILIPSGATFEIKSLTISDCVAQIIWSSQSSTAEIPFGSDTFLIEDEKIKVHTIATLLV
nr:nuclear transport factor 2 family protein [uncultured Flavobacterium sp.]